MADLLYRAVERLLAEGDSLSRNKNFDVFEDAHLKRARRIVKHIRSLRADLLEHGDGDSITITETPCDAGRRAIELSIIHLSGRRVAFLSAEEYRLLALDPAVATILAAAGETTSGEG